jgi:hypothetical protein
VPQLAGNKKTEKYCKFAVASDPNLPVTSGPVILKRQNDRMNPH